MRIVTFVGLTLGLTLVACGAGDGAGAIATAGMGVAGAGVYRATTGGCWGQCLNGLVCDRASGMCVKHSMCTSRCAMHERCEEGVVGRCVPILDSTAGIAVDAGTSDAGTTD